MDSNITPLILMAAPLMSVGFDLAGRKSSWHYFRWPWAAIAIGQQFGLKITAPLPSAIVSAAEKLVVFALVGCAAIVMVRWLWRRYRDRAVLILDNAAA